jgi:hypothetical protein
MHIRVVRFTGVTSERIDDLKRRIEASGGPPPDAPAHRLQLLFDAPQGTAVVLQLFNTAEDMRKGDEVFGAMDPAETPGTRASVDRCELALDMSA